MSINKLIKTQNFITGISRPDMKEVPASPQWDGWLHSLPALAWPGGDIPQFCCLQRPGGWWWVVGCVCIDGAGPGLSCQVLWFPRIPHILVARAQIIMMTDERLCLLEDWKTQHWEGLMLFHFSVLEIQMKISLSSHRRWSGVIQSDD